MRKLTASIFAATALAGGAFTGVAVAASPPSHGAERASLDRTASARDRAERNARTEFSSRERGSRDRPTHERQHSRRLDR